MVDLDRRLRRFYDAEGTRATLADVHVRRPTASRKLILATSAVSLALLFFAAVGNGARFVPASEPAGATLTAPATRVTLSERTAITVPSAICRIAAVGGTLLAAVANTRDQGASCHLAVSADDGATWRQESTSSGVLSVAIAPRGDLFAGLADGTLMRSVDARNWTAVYGISTAHSSPGIISFGFGADAMWAGGAGVLRSVDGVHWDDVTGGLGTFAADARARPGFGVVGLVPRPGGVIAAIAGNVPEVGVWAFDRAGGWRRIAPTRLGQPLGLVQAGTSLVLLTQRGSIEPGGSSTPAAWVSTDDGGTWQALDHGSGSGAVLRSVAAAGDEVIAAAADGIVEPTGARWELVQGSDSHDADARAAAISGSRLYLIVGESLIRYRMQPSP